MINISVYSLFEHPIIVVEAVVQSESRKPGQETDRVPLAYVQAEDLSDEDPTGDLCNALHFAMGLAEGNATPLGGWAALI